MAIEAPIVIPELAQFLLNDTEHTDSPVSVAWRESSFNYSYAIRLVLTIIVSLAIGMSMAVRGFRRYNFGSDQMAITSGAFAGGFTAIMVVCPVFEYT